MKNKIIAFMKKFAAPIAFALAVTILLGTMLSVNASCKYLLGPNIEGLVAYGRIDTVTQWNGDTATIRDVNAPNVDIRKSYVDNTLYFGNFRIKKLGWFRSLFGEQYQISMEGDLCTDWYYHDGIHYVLFTFYFDDGSTQDMQYKQLQGENIVFSSNSKNVVAITYQVRKG